MDLNGKDLGGIPMLGQKPKRVEWDNNLETHQKIAAQISEQVRMNGGGMPVADPGCYLMLMLVMDEQQALRRKLDHITTLLERRGDATTNP